MIGPDQLSLLSSEGLKGTIQSLLIVSWKCDRTDRKHCDSCEILFIGIINV